MGKDKPAALLLIVGQVVECIQLVAYVADRLALSRLKRPPRCPDFGKTAIRAGDKRTGLYAAQALIFAEYLNRPLVHMVAERQRRTVAHAIYRADIVVDVAVVGQRFYNRALARQVMIQRT